MKYIIQSQAILKGFRYLLVLIGLFGITSCVKNVKSKNQNVKYVTSIEFEESVDSILLLVKDASYLHLEEYSKWKTEYIILLHKEKLNANKIIQVLFENKTGDRTSYIFNQNDIFNLVNKYEKNRNYFLITESFFSDLSRSEVYQLMSSNATFNNLKRDYAGDISQLFFDHTLCNDTCFAKDRLLLIGEMTNETGLRYIWDRNTVLEPCNLVKWLNKLPTQELNLVERPYCKSDLIQDAIKIYETIKAGNKRKIKSSFYSEEFFEEAKIGEKDIEFYKNKLSNTEILKDELISIELMKIAMESKVIAVDSIAVTRALLPLSSTNNMKTTDHILIVTFANLNSEYRLLGYIILDIQNNSPINTKSP